MLAASVTIDLHRANKREMESNGKRSHLRSLQTGDRRPHHRSHPIGHRLEYRARGFNVRVCNACIWLDA
jgi:hypothetical protein